MRLIDADALSDKVFMANCGLPDCGRETCEGCCIESAMKFIKDAPTVDAEPITRCQDCAFWGTWVKGMHNGKLYGDCLNFEHATQSTFYCAWGDKMDEVEDE